MCILSFNNAIWIIMNSCGSIGPTWASLNSDLYTWRIWQSDKPIVWVSTIIQKMENYLECAIADWIEFMKPIGGKHIRQITVLSLGFILIICPCSSGSLPIFVALDRWPILYFLREVTTYNHLLCRMTTRADGRWSCWFAEFFALQFWHSSSPSFSRSLQENTVGFIIDPLPGIFVSIRRLWYHNLRRNSIFANTWGLERVSSTCSWYFHCFSSFSFSWHFSNQNQNKTNHTTLLE